MPGTGHVELMAAAAQTVAGTTALALQQVEFLSPLAFPQDAPRVVTVTVQRRRDGHEIVVASAPVGTTAEHDRTTHARAFAVVGERGLETLDVAAARARATQPAPASSDQDRHMAFGPRWQCLQKVALGDGEAFGELLLPAAFHGDLAEHRVHAALLDMAFGCGIRLLSANAGDALFVPVGCAEVVVHGRLPAALVSHVKVVARDERTRLGTLDVVLASPSGIVVLELRGLQLYGVKGAFGSGPQPTRATPASKPAPAPAPVPRIQAIVSRGITAGEGMRSLDRALQSGAVQVVASSLDLARTAAWLSLPPEKPRSATTVATAAAPGAAVDASAPRDDVERKLALAFQELLGVDRPGLDQDFFELGGHSLLAVRLFARVHKEFGLDLELATLLSAGTVRKLAGVVRTELKLPEPGSEPVRSVAARKGQHVVPIQTDGTRPKLFLVHGAGGNVLGFRDLAHYFGKDQPVYGLQARGVDGKQAPHTAIAEMADAYLAELREVQPHGPYHLGGYSGGGCVAYEMAQRLRALGEPVAFVGMIDSPCPQMPRRGKFGQAFVHVGKMLRAGPMYPVRLLRMKAERRAARVATQNAGEGGVVPQAQRGFQVQFAFENAFANHRVQAYAGPVWLFRAEEQDYGARFVVTEDLGWAPFVGDLRVTACPGNHFTMCTEPNVQRLCQAMMQALDAAIAAAQ
jgi:thioesterase domain-containing protein/acyl carrier protein